MLSLSTAIAKINRWYENGHITKAEAELLKRQAQEWHADRQEETACMKATERMERECRS